MDALLGELVSMCVRVCLHVCVVCASEFIYWMRVSLMGSILLILEIDK